MIGASGAWLATLRAVPPNAWPATSAMTNRMRKGTSGAPSLTRMRRRRVGRCERVRRHRGDAGEQCGEGADGRNGGKQDDREAGEHGAREGRARPVLGGGTSQQGNLRRGRHQAEQREADQGRHRQADEVEWERAGGVDGDAEEGQVIRVGLRDHDQERDPTHERQPRERASRPQVGTIARQLGRVASTPQPAAHQFLGVQRQRPVGGVDAGQVMVQVHGMVDIVA